MTDNALTCHVEHFSQPILLDILLQHINYYIATKSQDLYDNQIEMWQRLEVKILN